MPLIKNILRLSARGLPAIANQLTRLLTLDKYFQLAGLIVLSR
jgi:hypothetical protein